MTVALLILPPYQGCSKTAQSIERQHSRIPVENRGGRSSVPTAIIKRRDYFSNLKDSNLRTVTSEL
jgi:hypothetical protein